MLNAKTRIVFFAAVMILTGVGFAASTKEIDDVRKKTDLVEADLTVVDTFINEVFKEMLEAPTIADSVKRREDILVRKPKDEQPKYKEQFRKSVEANVNSALKAIETWNDEAFIKASRLNLAVIIGSLDDITLYETAIQMLNEESPSVKYWALKALTGKDVTNSVKANPASESSKAIVVELKKIAAVNSPVMLEMAASFAVSINGQDSYEILAAIAATRIESYKSWKANHESTDAKIMALMADKISSDAPSKAALAVPFAQLMSCTLEKYALSLAPDQGLDDVSQQQLVTVIAELEKKILAKFAVTANLTKPSEKRNVKEFNEAYNLIFGAEGTGGELAAKLGVEIKVEKLPQRQ